MGWPVLEVTITTAGVERAQELSKRFPKLLLDALLRANAKGSALVRQRLGQKLRGEVLQRRTGNLLRSWAVRKPVFVRGGVDGGVGSNSEYARYQEEGFHGNVFVRAHERRVTQVFGRPVSGVVAQVSAFTRAVDYAGKPYARPSLKESLERIDAFHRDEIRVAWESMK
jgi:hypothetical protein